MPKQQCAEPPLFSVAPAPDIRGPGADYSSAQWFWLRLQTLKFFILSSENLIIKKNIFFINWTDFMLISKTIFSVLLSKMIQPEPLPLLSDRPKNRLQLHNTAKYSVFGTYRTGSVVKHNILNCKSCLFDPVLWHLQCDATWYAAHQHVQLYGWAEDWSDSPWAARIRQHPGPARLAPVPLHSGPSAARLFPLQPEQPQHEDCQHHDALRYGTYVLYRYLYVFLLIQFKRNWYHPPFHCLRIRIQK